MENMASFWADFLMSWTTTVFIFTVLIVVWTTLYFLKKINEDNKKDKTPLKDKPVTTLKIINELEDIKKLLLEDKGCNEDFNVPVTLHDKALLKPKNKVWKEEDSIIVKKFVKSSVKKNWKPLLKATKFLEKYLEDKDNKIINSSEIMSTHALNILYATVFGKSFELNDPRILGVKTELETMLTLWPKFGYKPCLTSGDESDLDLISVKGEFMTRMKQAIMLHALDKENEERVFIDELNELKAGEASNIEEELAEYLLQYFLCGYEALAKLFSSMVMELAGNVEIQEKMFNNLKNNISSTESPNIIPFIQATLNELLRKVKPVPFIIRTKKSNLDEDGNLLDCPFLSKIDLEALFNNSEHWNCPENFDPSRFLKEDNKSLKEQDAFLPYSTGSRSCPGQILSETSSLMLLTTIVQKFRISVSESLPETDQNFTPIEIKVFRRQEENTEFQNNQN